jgi:uncharacterized protein YaaR (DUF327 family)
MPFDDREPPDPKVGLKKVNGPKSMFEGKPRPPTQQEFQEKVQEVQEKQSGYKKRAAELFTQFNKAISGKELARNRNLFAIEMEKEMLQNMIQLAIEINNDPNEKEGMGSLTWITCLFKTCLAQRDKINDLEYEVAELKKKMDSGVLADYINKEIIKALDKQKGNG